MSTPAHHPERLATANDQRLRQLCDRVGLSAEQVAGTRPVVDDQFDPYEIVGIGEIQGCDVVRYGRFGNNVLQLAYALQFARLSGLQWVRAKGFGDLFKPGRHEFGDGLALHVDDAAQQHGSALRGCYFFWWGLGGALRGISGAQIGAAVHRDLSDVLAIVPADPHPPEGALHLHLRGGDIFGPEGHVHPAYVQPPLAYYIAAADRWLASHPDGHLVIVSQDRLNPCVDPLLDWARKTGRPVRLSCSSEREDVGCLLAATEIVAGYGTFVPMIALLSKTVMKVTYFAQKQQPDALESLGISVDLAEDACERYIRRGEWSNSVSQRAIMLNYPASCIRWTSSRLAIDVTTT